MKTKAFLTLMCAIIFLGVNVLAQTGESSFKKINISKKKEEDKTMRGTGDPLKGLGVAEAEAQLQFGDYYALIIGIDNYKGEWVPLQNAVRDAKTVEQTLKDKYKFDHFRTLYDQNATRENILMEMEWLMKNVTEKDNVLIYYSGHGQLNRAMNKGFWVPVDATSTSIINLISNNDIQSLLAGIDSKHTLLVSDACFSGDIFRGTVKKVEFDNSDRWYREVNSKISRAAITSGGIEPVMDGGRDGHSVFAYYLLKQLNTNSKKYYASQELFGDIEIPVTNNSEQMPMFKPIKNTNDEGGQFIFIKK